MNRRGAMAELVPQVRVSAGCQSAVCANAARRAPRTVGKPARCQRLNVSRAAAVPANDTCPVSSHGGWLVEYAGARTGEVRRATAASGIGKRAGKAGAVRWGVTMRC